MNAISIVLVIIVAFLAGMEGILDEFQFHQPLVACTLIGIILMKGGQGAEGAQTAIAVAIPLAVAGLFLTMIARTLAVPIVHAMDAAAENADFKKIEMLQWGAIFMQGLRIAVPAAALCVVSDTVVSNLLNSMPAWLTEGMSIGGGMVVAVGYALVINMMATAEVWPFFFIGFALAAISDLTLIGLGIVAVAIAFIYLNLSEKGGSGAGAGAAAGGSGDPLGDILNDY